MLPEGMLTTDDVIQISGKSRQWIYRAVRENKLKSTKIGSVRIYARSDVNAWLKTLKPAGRPKKRGVN